MYPKITYKIRGNLISYIPLLNHVPKMVYQLHLNPVSNDNLSNYVCRQIISYIIKSNIYLNCNIPETHDA